MMKTVVCLVVTLQNDFAKRGDDCCIPSSSSVCTSKQCDPGHIAADPAARHCHCMVGYTLNPHTHACEGEQRSKRCARQKSVRAT